MTGTQVFQFDVHAIIQMIIWGLVLVAIATAFMNFGNKRNTTPAQPMDAVSTFHVPLTEDRVRQIVREEIAEALRHPQRVPAGMESKQ